MSKSKKPLTQIALSKLGGAATKAKHGKKHYKLMGLKRWHPELFAKVGLGKLAK